MADRARPPHPQPARSRPYQPAIAAAVGAERSRLTETLRARRLALLDALLTVVAGRDTDPTGRRLLGSALDLITHTTDAPLIPEVLHVLTRGGDPLHRIAAATGPDDYARTTRTLVNTLGLLCDGPLRGLFDQPSTVRPDADSPAVSLDISALDGDTDDIVAAAMLCSWAWAAALTDTTTRNVVQVQDELWRALRAAPGLVEKADRITRLGRHHGVVSLQITHSLDDLDALATDADRAKARGLASRTAILVLGGMPERDLDRLRGIVSLTDAERALVASWAAPPTWHTGHRHPGRGKYLIKSGQRIGLPVALTLSPAEIALHDTDTAFHTGNPR